MSTKDCNADKSRERTEGKDKNDCGCCEELACFEHYEVDDGIGPLREPESDVSPQEVLASVDVDTSGEMKRIDPIDDDDDDGPRRDWSNATMVRGPSGMARIDFSA